MDSRTVVSADVRGPDRALCFRAVRQGRAQGRASSTPTLSRRRTTATNENIVQQQMAWMYDILWGVQCTREMLVRTMPRRLCSMRCKLIVTARVQPQPVPSQTQSVQISKFKQLCWTFLFIESKEIHDKHGSSIESQQLSKDFLLFGSLSSTATGVRSRAIKFDFPESRKQIKLSLSQLVTYNICRCAVMSLLSSPATGQWFDGHPFDRK